METINASVMKVKDVSARMDRVVKKGGGGLLSMYYTAGFPALEDTVRIGKLLADSGADLIEIGVPFSDPVADGPVIQESSKVALQNGMTLKLLLQQVAELREQTDIPIILMGYFNPILQFGVESFCREAAKAGVDGTIIPDLPIAEFEQYYHDVFKDHGLQNIFLVSPTTSIERIRMIDRLTHSFIYAVSASSTTGAKNEFTQEQLDYFQYLKGLDLKNPLLIGFGISNKESFATACSYAGGAIIGSAFISMLQKSRNLESDIPSFIQSIKSV